MATEHVETSEASKAGAVRWILASMLLVFAVFGIYAWSQVRPLLTSKFADVSYTVPAAPHLVAGTGETVYRIDPSKSQVSYGIDERIVGQNAHRAVGSTSGIGGDLAINAANPSASRVGQIVVNVEELHSDNNLRDARIRASFLGSHASPLAFLNVAGMAGLPSSIVPGQMYHFTMTGALTVKSISAATTWDVDAVLSNEQLSATATTKVKMSTFRAGPINLAGLVSTSDQVTLTMKLIALNPSKQAVATQIAAPASAPHSGHSPSFKASIAPVLAANCAACHNSGQVGAAHWLLDTAGDAGRYADGIGVVTKAKYMPPWPASPAGVPLAHSKVLDQQTVDLLAQWARAGGQLDVPASTPIKPPTITTGTVPRQDVVLKMPKPYLGLLSIPNDYRCFVIDPHFTTATYVTGYTVTPDQRAEIHHAQIFHISAAQAAAGQALDGENGRTGWQCYGEPSLPDHQPSAGASGRNGRRGGGSFSQGGLIAGWVPGQDPVIYPQHSGILFQPGDAIVLQMHYHYDHAPVADQSTVALQTEPYSTDVKTLDIVNPLAPVEIPCMPGVVAPLCDRTAAIFDDARLYGPVGSFAEAGLLLVCHEKPLDMTVGFNGVSSSTCDSRVPVSGQIVGAMGHMHTLGKNFRLTLDPKGPSPTTLLDIPVWNFGWQMNYELATPIHVKAGDTIRMECTWDRSLDPNRAPKYIVFAEGTEDEMCFSTYALIPDNQTAAHAGD